MQIVIQINGRDALPVRTLPFVTRWAWRTSPDAIADACGQPVRKIQPVRDPLGAITKSVEVQSRGALPSYFLEDGEVRPIHPEEWEIYRDELSCLTKKLKADERLEDENLAKWRTEAIKALPAAAFVWLDEFQQWFESTCEDFDDLLVGVENLNVLDDLANNSNPELTLRPIVMPELADVVMDGFDADTLLYNARSNAANNPDPLSRFERREIEDGFYRVRPNSDPERASSASDLHSPHHAVHLTTEQIEALAQRPALGIADWIVLTG